MIGITLLAAAMIGNSVARLLSLSPDCEFPAQGVTVTKQFGPLDPAMDFNEAIVSWNVDNAAGAAVKVEARAYQAGAPTKWYTLGDWASDVKLHPRMSVDGQKDANGTVMTDTLHLFHPGQQLELQITLENLSAGDKPRLKFVTVSFSNIDATTTDSASPSTAWGKTVDVPERAQNNYPNGGVLCSATSVSMMLWHYSNVLARPDLNHDVPDVQAGVWDTVYKGAGNWPFNTAYAGSFSGMRAYVARFTGIADLEKWIDIGLPVVCSVSFDMIQGKPLGPGESGHLVVLVGFTKDGDPIFNDPAWKSHVRTTYKRADFEKAWMYSHRTVYLIYPEDGNVPADPQGLWTP